MFQESRPEITGIFQTNFAQIDTTIKPIIDWAAIWAAYMPPVGWTIAGRASEIRFMQAIYNLPSIRRAPVPDITLYEADEITRNKMQENYRLAPCKAIKLSVDLGDGIWQNRSETWIQNVGQEGFKELKMPYLSDASGFWGANQKVGAQIVPAGFPASGGLGANDYIRIHGSYRIIPTLVPDLGAKPFASAQGFSVNVGTTSPVQVLPLRNSRSLLYLTSTGKIWFSFANSSAGVAPAGACAFLSPGGALTYENGRLAFDGGRGDIISLKNTLGFPLWAIAQGSTATVSGTEYF
ncbi:MAG: hypothetical protein JGK30_07915 [Microcoleus sp. PH2017_40_RAT_O_B]|uniref:hypothetical protein n=1 Tax=unclassified Microcoleus TaxID=2642155 RepID=UPI001D4A5FCA|nr:MULTISPECIES: hypothetical protein [unclassified Microcoleus]MCC3508291.1 hypothetical protein [Microcoleus sp. PH2017_17_BER_D_A]TAE66795.1 MAG: hypothetical protein EAZ86_19350 [Oscillatoriales cyanobacterium]MCC3572157.1 hypothetical protein [Microcoleus sp. PH2017_34_RAT_O_A]MCC3609428.1 hypothetical protein [Microcoleus sp. PH2017_40_RAT_O_B]TAG60314.1 MAG: hypothetical protein EAZ28_08000 [Oscillatoriales cyanobacterium]